MASPPRRAYCPTRRDVFGSGRLQRGELMGDFLRAATMMTCVVLLPAVVAGQTENLAALAGVAKDGSGAVLPGVTVEGASPHLIAEVRTAVTDGSGQYRIISLQPGPYTVTFTLTGFTTI